MVAIDRSLKRWVFSVTGRVQVYRAYRVYRVWGLGFRISEGILGRSGLGGYKVFGAFPTWVGI